MKITARQLSGEHIGKTVTVPAKEGITYTGKVTRVTQFEDLTEVTLLRANGMGRSISADPTAPITIQEEK